MMLELFRRIWPIYVFCGKIHDVDVQIAYYYTVLYQNNHPFRAKAFHITGILNPRSRQKKIDIRGGSRSMR